MALSFAVCALSLYPYLPLGHDTGGSDYAHYHEIAQNLLHGNGFMLAGRPDLYRAPGYPVWLAGIYALTGNSLVAVRWVQIILVALTVWLTARLGRQLAGNRVGIIAAYVAALNPVLIHYSIRPYSEPLFTFLALLSVIIIGPAMARIVRWRILLGGVVAGLACLVRPQMLIMPLFLAPWWLWRLKWRGAAAAAAFTLAMWLAISPWTVRNYVVSGHFIPVQIQSGHVLWLSNNERVLNDPIYWGYNVEPTGSQVTLAGPNSPIEEQIRSDREKRAEALRFLRENASRVPLLVAYKFARFFSLGTKVALWKRVILFAFDLPLVPLALVGIILLWRRGVPELGPTLAGLLTTLATVAVFWGDSRFRFTIEPYLIALSAAALVSLWGRLRPARGEAHSADST